MRRSSRSVLAAVVSLGLTFAAPAVAQWAPTGNRACTFDSDQFLPCAVPDGAGGAFVAWIDGRGAHNEVYAQRVASDGTLAWGANGVPVSAGSARAGAVSATPDGAGGVIFAWSVIGEPSITYRAQRLSGTGAVLAGWPAGGVLLGDGNSSLAPRVVPDGAGGAYFSWVFSYGVELQRVVPAGALAMGWPAGGFVVAQGINDAFSAGLAPGSTSDALLVFAQDYTTAQLRRYTSPTSTWSWSDPDPHATFDVDVVSDQNGGAVVSTMEYSANSTLFVHRVTASGASHAGWPAAGVTAALTSNIHPFRTASDGQGGVLVASITQAAPARLAIQRVAGAGAVAAGWPALGVVPGGDATQWSVTDDGLGGAYVAWVNAGRLYAQHLADDAAVVWESGGVEPGGAAAVKSDPVAVRDGTASAIFAWTDSRNPRTAIFVQKIESGIVGVPVERTPSPLALAIAGSDPKGLDVRLTLARGERATLRLYDVTGRVVAGADLGLPSGSHRVRLDVPRGTGSGVFFLRLSEDGQGRTVRFTRLR